MQVFDEVSGADGQEGRSTRGHADCPGCQHSRRSHVSPAGVSTSDARKLDASSIIRTLLGLVNCDETRSESVLTLNVMTGTC